MKAPVDAMPQFIEPARATAIAEPPSDATWVHEIKMDGYRVQARLEDGHVRLTTRGGHDWTDRFLGLVPAFETLRARSAILDGEVIVEDSRGVSDFALLQAALKSPRSPRLAYVAFDMLYHDGESLLGRSFIERKARLEALLTGHRGALRFCQHFVGDGRLILIQAARLGVEGIVSKRLAAPYRPGRDDWRKYKITLIDEFVVCGYVEAVSPKASVGSLVLGFHEADMLVYAGRVGTGFTRLGASEWWQALQSERRATATLTVPDAREETWVEPRRVVQVQYSGWTADGLLRHARYKGLRDDKPADAVVRPAQRL